MVKHSQFKAGVAMSTLKKVCKRTKTFQHLSTIQMVDYEQTPGYLQRGA